MPQLIRNWLDRQTSPTMICGNEHGDLPVDDPPPAEHPTEQYVSWRATAIYNLSPFSAPSVR